MPRKSSTLPPAPARSNAPRIGRVDLPDISATPLQEKRVDVKINVHVDLKLHLIILALASLLTVLGALGIVG